MEWTCSCKEEIRCAQRIFDEKTTKKIHTLKAEKGRVFLHKFLLKICYTDRMCMEQDQVCVLLWTLSQDLKMRVPKLSLYE